MRRSGKVIAGMAVGLVAIGAAWVWLRRHAEPIARERIVESLEAKLHCEVELDEVHLSLAHGLEVTGRGLRIMAIGNRVRISPGGTPMLTVREFQFASTLKDLLLHHESAITAYAQGLVITLPAGTDREKLDQSDPKRRNQPRDSYFLNKLVATESLLRLEPTDRTKANIEFDFKKLVLVDPGKDVPFVFETILRNPMPSGEIHATGHIGPWVFGSSRDSPVDGNFTFDHADLSDVKGLNGTLTAHGRIAGSLGQMTVHGETETPDFGLDISAHTFPLHTEFQALVEGTTGDVALQSVAARFLHTELEGNGLIRKVLAADGKETKGHNIAIDVHMKNGRAEDLLTLFSRSPEPLLRSPMDLQGHVEVPPGKERLVLKMRASGTAQIGAAHFTNVNLQQSVNAFSLRAQDVHQAKQAIQDPGASPVVAMSLSGPFRIVGGNIEMPDVTSRAPGAVLAMQGRYPLVERELQFHGVARTVAPADHMETGIKSLLLKPVSPFLHKNGAGTQLPISFMGDKGHPVFHLDLKNHGEDGKVAEKSHTNLKP